MTSTHLSPMDQLLQLDASSTEFPDQVSNKLYGQEYQQWVEGIQGDDVVQLIDWLDKVRYRVSLFLPIITQVTLGSRHSRSCQFRLPKVHARA